VLTTGEAGTRFKRRLVGCYIVVYLRPVNDWYTCWFVSLSACVCVCMCVCVTAQEGRRDRLYRSLCQCFQLSVCVSVYGLSVRSTLLMLCVWWWWLNGAEITKIRNDVSAMFIHLHRHVGLYISRTVLVGTVLHACELGLGLTRLQASLSVLIQKQRGFMALHYWMGGAHQHHCSGLPRLRNDLYCVEWDVKP